MAQPAAVLNILVTANTKQASASLARLNSQLGATAATAHGKSSAMGASIAKGAGRAALGLAAVGGASLVAAAQFEDAFADVRKTVDATEPQFDRIEKGIRDMAKEIPVAATDLAHLAGEAGALGVKSKDIVKFTRVAADLGVATDLSAEAASNALARLANIMDSKGKKAFERMGSALVDLGNKGASTESEITEMALRIAGAGQTIGLTEAQVLGFAAALANVGVRAEAGGSSISRVMLTIQDAVAQGGEELAAFAEIAGVSTDVFAQKFAKDAPAAIQLFTAGLDKVKDSGGSVVQTLESVGLNEIRVRDALLRLGGATGEVTKAQEIANAAWGENNALAEEAEKRYKTTASQFAILKNRVFDLGITFGQDLLPQLNKAMKLLGKGDLGGAIAAMAELGAKMGAKLIGAIGKAFLESNVLGKLFIAGAFIRLVGGKGALLALGKALAGWIAAPMATTIAGTVGAEAAAGGALAGKFKGMGKVLGRTMGLALAAGVLFAITDSGIRNKILDIFRGEKLGAGLSEKFAMELGDLGLKVRGVLQGQKVVVTTALGDLVFSAKTKTLVEDKTGEFKKLVGKNINAILPEIEDAVERTRRGMFPHWKGIVDDADKKLHDLNQKADKISGSVRDKLVSRTGRMAGGVVANVGRMVNKASEGLQTLGDNTNEALAAFKVGKKVSFSIKKAAESVSSFAGSLGRQRGGAIPGFGSGDKVPAMLEPGEVVINRKAVAAMGGPRKVDAVNHMLPRFQSGGVVGLGRQLQRQGFQVGEHPAFGGVTGVHSPGSFHYRGMAIDVNHDQGGEAAALDRLYSRLKGMPGVVELLWRVADHFDHLHVAMSGGAKAMLGGVGNLPRLLLQGPDGPLRDMGQGAMDKVRKAANAFLSKQTMFEGAEPSAAGGGIGKSRITNLWTTAGGSPRIANLAAAVALAESGGVPNALNRNSNGTVDRGLWQINSIHGALSTFDPLGNARGALKISGGGTNWSPWVQYNNNAYRQFLQSGGIVQHLATGGTAFKKQSNNSLFNALHRISRGIRRNDERLEIAQALASLPKSPGGEDLVQVEKAQQIGLYSNLLDRLRSKREVLGTLIPRFRDRKHPKGRETLRNLRDQLQEIQGLTGAGGRLLDTKVALRELSAAGISGGAALPMSISDFARFAEAVRFGVTPQFHAGGIVGGGSQEVIAKLQRGEGVIDAGTMQRGLGTPEIRVFIGDRELTDIVRVEMRDRERKSKGAYRAGVAR